MRHTRWGRNEEVACAERTDEGKASAHLELRRAGVTMLCPELVNSGAMGYSCGRVRFLDCRALRAGRTADRDCSRCTLRTRRGVGRAAPLRQELPRRPRPRRRGLRPEAPVAPRLPRVGARGGLAPRQPGGGRSRCCACRAPGPRWSPSAAGPLGRGTTSTIRHSRPTSTLRSGGSPSRYCSQHIGRSATEAPSVIR